MTSTNDGKDVKSNQTSSHKGKSYYIDIYKTLETHLSAECELRERTQHLCSAWRRVHSLCQHSAHTTHPHYLAWLQRHTANTLLQSEWQSEKDEHAKLAEAIDSFIAESESAAISRNGQSPAWETQLVQRGEWFKRILGNPWGHPVLKVLCDPRGKPPSDEDILEWLKEERGVMFVTRLRHLAASKKCHEIALSLATAVMDRKRACETIVPDAEQADEQEPPQPEGNKPKFKDILRSEAGFTVDVWELLTDLEFVLLHKRNEHAQCIALAKKIPLRSGYQLVERLRSRPEASPREKKLWKNAGDVATLVAQVLITRCMVVPTCGGAVRSALYCCARSLVRLLPAHALCGAAGALAAPAATARHLHTLAAAVHTQLHAQKAEDMNSFVCELYVRAITAGMNELEKLKIKTEKESEARSMEQTLASWFTSLGSLLSCSARIQCECALTAFSVHPSAAMYDKICAAPRLPSHQDKQEPKEETTSEFGSWASDSRSQTNLVKTSETLNLKQTQQHTNVMSTAIFAEGEAIGLSADLCQDLTVCLSGPRVKTLSWDMDREVLLSNCRSYMERTHGGTRALTTELKYLNLDPREYQHLPEEGDDENDVYYGIERGYEHLVELQEEVGWQEDIFDHEVTETAYSSEEMIEVPVRRKKKTKRPVMLSGEDSDPLSTLTESNKGDKKKERPHSKERSKEKKKKPKNPEDKEKRKEKKERKKKEKVAKPGSLASLIGVKVSTELGLISDSDYDSQGKSSLASEGNDPNVVFDGLFNMDDPLSDRPLVNSELSVTNGKVAVTKAPKKKPSGSKKKPKSSANIATTETKPVHTVKSILNFNLNTKPSRPSAVGVVSDQVKRSITKLLQFRRNQNSMLAHKNTPSTTPKTENKPLNAIYKPEFPTQQVISPKSVIVPEIPKSYINKAQMERLDAERSSSVLLNPTQTNASIGHALYRSDSDRQQSIQSMHVRSNSEVIAPQTHSSFTSPQTHSSSQLSSPVSKYKDILNIPNYYQNMNYKVHNSPNILTKNQSNIHPNLVSMSLSRVETPRPQEHAKSYEDFLIDLKTAANPVPSSSPGVGVKKDVRSISGISPIMPGLPYTDPMITQQCAKPTQKKVDNAPNTFSRLSYMKNKQSDLKHKQTLETHASRQEEWTELAKTSADLSRCMSEFKNTKIKYIQTKGDTVITRVDNNPLNLSCDNANVVQKAENEPSTSRSHSITNLFQPSTSMSQVPISRYGNVDTTKVTIPTAKTSYLSEKDQNDLLLLLRQQSRINAVRNVSKHVPPTPQAPINMTTVNASVSVMSKFVQSTSLLNNNLQQYANTIESKETKSIETKLENDVIRQSKNATNPGGRDSKKAVKTSANVRNCTYRPKPKESDTLDWEKVMNAIRAQKTPSRGPSALELALNSADSSDKSLRNQRIVRTSSVGETDKIAKIVDAVTSQSNIINTPKSSVTSFPKPPIKPEINTTQVIQNKSVIVKTAQSNVQNTPIECKKSIKNVSIKSSGEVDKKQMGGEKIKFATTIAKNKDPFISGREEDYNLSDLDDLLDDELRRELGELSSDEDSYRIPQTPKGTKMLPSSKNHNSLNKQGPGNSGSQKEKIQVPNPPHTPNNQYGPDGMPVSNCQFQYTKSKGCVRSQTNKIKTKMSAHNSLQYQNVVKATSIENLDEKSVGKDKPLPKSTDLSSQHQIASTSSTCVNKNIRKVSAPNLHYQYSTVNKDMLKEAAGNQTADPCLDKQYSDAANRSTCIIEEPRKVYMVPAVAQPASNIVLLGSEMYYSPIIPIIQNNMNPIFVQQTNIHNITMPQSAYCTPASVSHISTDAVTTPALANFDKTSHGSNKLNSSATSQIQFNDKSGQVDLKTGCVKPTVKTPSFEDKITNQGNTEMFDINSNKHLEQNSSVSEVQENKNHQIYETTPILTRSRSISTEEVLRDILNDQDQTVNNDLLLKNSTGKKVINDITEPYSIKDIERLKRKRLAIINRQIIQSCIHPPIALSYAPIVKEMAHIDICEKKSETSLAARKIKVASQYIVNSTSDISIDVKQKKTDTLQTTKKVEEEAIRTPFSNHEEASNNEYSKENSSNSMTCRRIMLRSSNKNLPNIPTDLNDQNPIGRKTKVRLKQVKVQTEIDKTKIKDDTNKQKTKKTSDELVPSKTNLKKKVRRKTAVTKNKSKLAHNSKEHKNTKVLMSESLPVISTGFDIEDALLGSKIVNLKPGQAESINASNNDENEKSNVSTNKADNIIIFQNKKVKFISPQSTSSEGVVDEKSNVRANKIVILQNKKVRVKRKRKSSKMLVTNSNKMDEASKTAAENTTYIDTGVTNNLSDNQRVTRSAAKTPVEKQTQENIQPQMKDVTMGITKQQIIVSKINPVVTNDVTKREQSNSIVNNETYKAQTSNLDTSTDVIKSQSNDTIASSEKTINELIKITKNKKINHEQADSNVKNTSKTFQNILENFIVTNNQVTEEVNKPDSAKTFQNMLENFIVTNNQLSEELNESDSTVKQINTVEDLLENCQQTIDRKAQSSETSKKIVPPQNTSNSDPKDLLESCQQKTDRKAQSSETSKKIVTIQNTSNSVLKKSILCSSHVVTPNVECNKILHDKRQLLPNAAETKSSNVGSPHVDVSSKICENAQIPTNAECTSSSNIVSPQVVDSNITLPEKTNKKPNENTISRHISSNDTEKCNIPQSYKDSIIIEEIPNVKGSDVTKLLRVKLPNGKIFKASVYGKMHTSFDSLFEEPSLRAMLMSDLNEQRKYTLNIKQISRPNRENPDKPIESRIQEIQVKSKSVAPAVVETIDLLSDEEENDDNRCFKTKSGVYKTIIEDKDIVAKHQAKFDQSCYVKLERLILPKFIDCPEVLHNSDVIEIDGVSDNLDEIIFPPVFMNSQNHTIPTDAFVDQNIASVIPITQNGTTVKKHDDCTDVIDIDESSNDSIDLLKNCLDLPVGLIAGVPLISNDKELLEDVNRVIVEDSTTKIESESVVDNTINTADNTNNKNEAQTLEDTTDFAKKELEMSLRCSPENNNERKTIDDNFAEFAVNTSNLEEVLQGEDNTNKAESINNENIMNDKNSNQIEIPGTLIPPKYVKPVSNESNQCNDILLESCNCYVSLARCDGLVEYYNVQNALNRRCSVSLSRCDSIIESLKSFENDVDVMEINDRFNDTSDKAIDESDIEVSSTASISLLNDLSFPFENDHKDNGRNSPVIEVFEAIASLREKCETNKEIKTACHADKFECEWLLTKQQIHNACKFIKGQENKSVLKKSCTSPLDDLSSEKQGSADILVPSLVSLLTLFFQDGYILDQLKHISKKHNINRINMRPALSLKRKMPRLADNNVSNKVAKSAGTEVLLTCIENSIVINKCMDGEDSKTMTIPSDKMQNEDKSFIMENKMLKNINLRNVNISELVSVENQGSNVEIIGDYTDEVVCVRNEHNQNDLTIKNIEDSSINTYSELAPKEIIDTEIVCMGIDNKNQCEIMVKDINKDNSLGSELTSRNCLECETESSQDITENIIYNSKTVKDIAQKQDILEVAIEPNQNLQMDKLIDTQNDNIVSTNSVLGVTDKISTPPEKTDDETVAVTANIVSSHTSVENSQTVSSQQCDATDVIKIIDNERFDAMEAKVQSQNQQTDEQQTSSPCQENYEHLQSDLLGSNITEHITSDGLTTNRLLFDYKIEVENLLVPEAIVDDGCEDNNIQLQISENDAEVNQENATDGMAKSECDVINKHISPNEFCVTENNTVEFDGLIEKHNDTIDIKESISELQTTNITMNENLNQDTDNNSTNEEKHCEVEGINDEQLVGSTVIEKSKVNYCDSTTDLNNCIDDSIPDIRIDPEIVAIQNDCGIALEVICGDAVNIDNDQIALVVGELYSDEINIERCNDIVPKAERMGKSFVCNQIPDHEYTDFLQAPDGTTKMLTFEKDNDFEVTCAENHVFNDNSDNQSKCVLKGVEIEDPDVGVVYVLYPIDDSLSDTATLNGSCDDVTETFEDTEDINDVADRDDSEDVLAVNIPKTTYSKRHKYDLRFKPNLKRKIDFTDSKFTPKKYRKGKNIDYPKSTAASILERGYTKEYKRVLDYSSSLKFSYTQPFHKDYLDINNTIKDWPIKGPCVSQPELATESQSILFTDTETNLNYEPEALRQTLEEEINQNYTETIEPSSDINENNFSMGFGEGSGRVIQNLEDVGDISKVSAATLSDVKQPQPFLLSEDCEHNPNNKNATKDYQIEKIQRYLTYLKLRDRVKSFFQKNFIELEYDALSKKKKDIQQTIDSTNFPFDLYTQDFIEPRPFEAIVQVVQVGQLPVSAAAQNPVTCDPRVTQVTDASPSQCSVESSLHDESSTPIKTEYTELTTADLSLPLVQDYAQHAQTMDLHENQNMPMSDENIPIETEIKSVVKIELMEELPEEKEKSELLENTEILSLQVNNSNNEYSYEENNTATAYETNNTTTEYETPPTIAPSVELNEQMMYDSTEKQTVEDEFPQEKQQNGSPEKTDQIAHAMSAAGITTTAETVANNRAHALVNMLSQKMRQGAAGANTTTANSYPKTTSINAMALQQALAQILPPPLNQTNVNDNNQQTANNPVTPQVLHIVQGKNASGSQITLVDNSQPSVISGTNATPVLHIVQNKAGTQGATTNGATATQTNSFSGLSLVDAGLQQGGNQLLHIVNTGSQKNNNAGQLLKRVNLLTNLANVQGSNEQKMVQFVCKSADGKSIQLNAPHQRSMVLRLQPIESPVPATQPKTAENQECPSPSATAQNKDSASQQEIKSRSVYEENYAKFIQNSSTKPAAAGEKSTSLPKFNQAFGKPVFQDGTPKSNEVSNNMPATSTPSENSECTPTENNAINLEHISQISSPPLLLRKSPAQTSQAQTNLVQQIKQTIAPMNIQTMHGGVIYTRQIPVNIGGGQTINLITVPSTELIDDSGQKQQSANQGEIEPSIIKIVPQSQPNNNAEVSSEDNGNNVGASTENNQNPQPQPQQVLTQMRIKLPMLSKTPQMVSGARVVRPSFFQIQRNVIGGANQPVYQQLVLTAAPPLGQQTIRLPTAQANRQQLKVPSESQSTESMSSSTLEQLREFDMVLEQVKERSTVQPTSNSSSTFPKLHTPSSDTTDNATTVATTPSESSQVLYSIGNNQTLNVAYVNRKTTVSTPTTSTFVRSPDSSGIADSPTSSTHVSIPHTVTSESTSSETPSQPKPAKIGSKSKSRPKSSSHPPNNMKINPVPPKTSTQKPLEDEQTTQRILYILAEYKEQVENSPDKDKPAPRRRSNPPSNPGSSKRKKSSSGSRRHGRDMSPIHGDDTCRTMGSEDSSCGTSQGDCNESCLDSHSPQDSPRKIVRKLTFEHETPAQQPRPQPQRNVIVADGQTITVARGTAGKPTTAVLMPANYILPVSMVKGGQQIAIVTNRGPKLLTVGGGEGGTTNALLLQRLIGPAGLKPVLARPGVRHVRLPTAALHNLQAFNLAAATVQPPDSTASPAPTPELVETRAASSPWTDRESQDVKPERGSSPEGSEPWNLPSSADPHDYTYEETVRADNMDRTVLDAMPDRYSPDMEAQRIFDKMFDVDSKKSYIVDSPRCGYDIDASDCDDKPYHQVVQKKDGTSQRHHRLTHVSAAALRHKYAILEHELRLQKSLSEECEDLGVDSPSASELFPEAELLFAASPAPDHPDQGPQSHTPQPSHPQSSIPQPDMDDQIATDQLLQRDDIERQQLELGLDDVGIVTVGDGLQHIALDHEEFARAHPNTTFHSEPTDDAPVQPFTIAGLKGRHITSTIFHSHRAPATVLMTAPQTTVISQATAISQAAAISQADPQPVKYGIDHMIHALPSPHNLNLASVLVKDDGLTRFDNILNDNRELHLTHTASAIVHSTGNATQVIRRVCYDDKRDRDSFLMDEPDALIAGDDAKMIAEDSSRDATLESMDVDDDRSSPERHTELFWESNSASERSESRRPLDFSSDSDKCCKSPSYDETNSTDSSGVGTHMRLDSVIKDARIERSGSADGSSADDTHPPLRTYPPKRMYHPLEGEMERSLTGKTRAGERSPGSPERRRVSARGVVKRGCHCCNGDPAPPRPKKPRQRKPTMDFTN